MPAVLTSEPSADSPAGAPEARAVVVARSRGRAAPLASALDALGVMVLHVGLDGRVVAWNRSAREALGPMAVSDAGRLDAALSRDAVAATVRRVAAQGTLAWESDWPRADGRRQRVRVAVDLETGGMGTGLLCCATPLQAPAPPEAPPQEPWLDAFFRRAPLPACVQGPDMRIVAVNAAYCEMLGYDASELVGRDPTFLVAPEHLDEFQRTRAETGSWRHLAKDGATRTLERRYVRRDGRTLTLRIHVTAIDDPRSGLWVCTLTEDLTADRHRVDQLIRDNELFRLLFEESPSPKSIQDASFRLVKVNRAYCEMFGYEASELLGRDPIELTAPEDREAILEQRARAARGERMPTVLTRRIRRADGGLRVCRLMLTTTHASDGSRIELVTLHDETEEIRMQQRLRAYWQRFERFFEQAPVGLMISDASGRVALVNRALEDIVGRPRDRLIGSPDALGDARFEPGGPSVRQRTSWVRDDGSTRWIDRIDRELEDLDGRPMRLTVVHDVTRERHLRDELMETEERFRQFAELVDDAILVADPGLSHVQYVNARFESIWGVPVAELARRPGTLFDRVAADDRAQVSAMFSGPAAGDPHEAVVRLAHPRLGDRSIRLRVFGQRAAPAGGASPARVFAIAEDVTDTLRQERARLDDAIRQRDVLVREVHHRIKNNLQGVAGLLQQSASSRPELAAALDEVAGRIQAIAQVHGLQVRDGEALVLRRVVAAVFDNLGRTFGLPLSTVVDDEAGVGRWCLPEQEAVPLALVFNELGTNAIRHREASASVDVRMDALPDGIALEIAGDGTLPAGFDIASVGPASSGLGLVKALLPRRGARMTLAQRGARVVARLELTAPALRARDEPDPDPDTTRTR
jgi:PAS domain S-box-containing protein